MSCNTVAVKTERSQYHIQLNSFSPVSVIRPVGELAEDLDYKKNIAYSGKNQRVGLFLEFQHFNKENQRIIVTFKTDLTKYLWEFHPQRGAEALNQRARSAGAEKSATDRTKPNDNMAVGAASLLCRMAERDHLKKIYSNEQMANSGSRQKGTQ